MKMGIKKGNIFSYLLKERINKYHQEYKLYKKTKREIRKLKNEISKDFKNKKINLLNFENKNIKEEYKSSFIFYIENLEYIFLSESNRILNLNNIINLISYQSLRDLYFSISQYFLEENNKEMIIKNDKSRKYLNFSNYEYLDYIFNSKYFNLIYFLNVENIFLLFLDNHINNYILKNSYFDSDMMYDNYNYLSYNNSNSNYKNQNQSFLNLSILYQDIFNLSSFSKEKINDFLIDFIVKFYNNYNYLLYDFYNFIKKTNITESDQYISNQYIYKNIDQEKDKDFESFNLFDQILSQIYLNQIYFHKNQFKDDIENDYLDIFELNINYINYKYNFLLFINNNNFSKSKINKDKEKYKFFMNIINNF